MRRPFETDESIQILASLEKKTVIVLEACLRYIILQTPDGRTVHLHPTTDDDDCFMFWAEPGE